MTRNITIVTADHLDSEAVYVDGQYEGKSDQLDYRDYLVELGAEHMVIDEEVDELDFWPQTFTELEALVNGR